MIYYFNSYSCLFVRGVHRMEEIMILKDIWLDVKAVQERDPAARHALAVLLLYQGVHALIWHRFAHWLDVYKRHVL